MGESTMNRFTPALQSLILPKSGCAMHAPTAKNVTSIVLPSSFVSNRSMSCGMRGGNMPPTMSTKKCTSARISQ